MTVPFPFSTFDMSIDEAQRLFDIYTKLKSTYSVEVDREFNLPFSSFETFRNNGLNDKGSVFKINNGHRPFFLCFPEIQDWLRNSRYSPGPFIEFQTWGYYKLKEDFGHVLIRTETFLDKIHELINPVELDFEDDKPFSRRFFVLTNDKLKAQLKITNTFRELIKQINLNEVIIEIKGDELLIGDKKVISEDRVLALTEFLNNLSKTFY